MFYPTSVSSSSYWFNLALITKLSLLHYLCLYGPTPAYPPNLQTPYHQVSSVCSCSPPLCAMNQTRASQHMLLLLWPPCWIVWPFNYWAYLDLKLSSPASKSISLIAFIIKQTPLLIPLFLIFIHTFHLFVIVPSLFWVFCFFVVNLFEVFLSHCIEFNSMWQLLLIL